MNVQNLVPWCTEHVQYFHLMEYCCHIRREIMDFTQCKHHIALCKYWNKIQNIQHVIPSGEGSAIISPTLGGDKRWKTCSRHLEKKKIAFCDDSCWWWWMWTFTHIGWVTASQTGPAPAAAPLYRICFSCDIHYSYTSVYSCSQRTH